MSKEYRAKVFKSGNSLALRLPKALGVAEGTEFRLVRDDEGRILAHPTDDGVTLESLFGSFSPAFMADGRMPDGDSPRVWDRDEPYHSAA